MKGWRALRDDFRTLISRAEFLAHVLANPERMHRTAFGLAISATSSPPLH